MLRLPNLAHHPKRLLPLRMAVALLDLSLGINEGMLLMFLYLAYEWYHAAMSVFHRHSF